MPLTSSSDRSSNSNRPGDNLCPFLSGCHKGIKNTSRGIENLPSSVKGELTVLAHASDKLDRLMVAVFADSFKTDVSCLSVLLPHIDLERCLDLLDFFPCSGESLRTNSCEGNFLVLKLYGFLDIACIVVFGARETTWLASF